ncbi:MAG: CoA transferase [Chloroflexi bacterium]|nr:CoA transferase [Chloroflexota bacterium]
MRLDQQQYPLAGIRVVDFGWVWAVPFMTQLLGDMGAEIIKVESHARLDSTRTQKPAPGRPAHPDWSTRFHAYHRNKKSITLNMATPRAIELVKRLIRVSDVVTDNFTPHVLENWGIDYAAISKIKPDIIMASLSSAGQWGPLRNLTTFAPALGAISGLETMVGYYGERPLGSTLAYMDPVAGTYGAFAVLAALSYRERTGRGQFIDMSQMEACITLIGEAMMDYAMNGRVWGAQGNRQRGMAPHNLYRCKGDDQWISIAVKSEEEWRSLCSAMGNPQWTQDPTFADQLSRWEHQDALDQHINRWTQGYGSYELMDMLQRAGVAAMPSLTTAQEVQDPHLLARGTWVQVDHPTLAGEIVYGNHWKFSRNPGGIYRHAPLLGEHNQYVLGDLLGISTDEIKALEEERVLY